jgi:hypothetical protein
MKIKTALLTLAIILLAAGQFGMARQGQYDEEAREQERLEKMQRKAQAQPKSPAKNFVGGLEEATVGSTTSLVEETAESAKEEGPVVGTLEGARQASGTVLDKTLKGAVKVATLGYGDLQSYEIEEPRANTDETTKIKLSF